MDARNDRIGEHAAEHARPGRSPPSARSPATRLDRLDWQHQAASIGAYRELSGYDHPADPIGPEPSRGRPGPAGRLARGPRRPRPGRRPRRPRPCPTAGCCMLRDTYAARDRLGTPPSSATNSARSALGARNAHLAAIRAAAEADAARKAGDHDRARRHETLAASYQALHDHYRQREPSSPRHGRPADWEHATAVQRHLAIAADAELRRRHPDRGSSPCARPNQAPPATSTATNRP